MEIFLYSSEIEGKGKVIKGMIEELIHGEKLHIYRSVAILSQNLQEPWEEKPIVVALIHRNDELLDLVSIREQLHPLRLILVLPDAQEDVISLAHRLRPNFLTYIHRDLDELKAVLKKIKGS